MKHSGLQKSISSIFDGNEPVKQEASDAGIPSAQKPVAALPARPQPAALTAAPRVDCPAVPIPTATAYTPSVVSAPAGQPMAGQVIKPATRPRPVPKKKSPSRNTIYIKDLWKTIQSRLTGNSKGSLDSRQKKTLILGISLFVVFAVVLMFVLGSGPSGAKAAPKSGLENASSENAPSGNTENWQKPEIYPMSLRDPMKPSSSASKGDAQLEGEMIVRGIVYSSDKPSAIIANQIVNEGDVIVGVKIIKIGKDFVAFEKDGKRWQQQVRQ